MKTNETPHINHTAVIGILSHIQDGMTVVDAEGDKIGKVKYVRFGDETEAKPGPETVTAPVDPTHNSFIEDVAQAFVVDNDLPEVLKARLLRHGFVRIDRGMFKRDAVVMPDNILQVSEDQITLNVMESELAEL